MRLAGGLVVVALVSGLSGCGWLMGEEGYFRDRGDEYRKARAIPPMQVPEGKRTDAIEELYQIPVERTDVLLGESFEVPRPTPLVGDPEENVVRIQKLGEEQWILLDGAPGEVWPRIRAFLISNQIGIENEDASKGMIETGWLAFKSDPRRREKYRYRVDQGVQRNSTEVYVTQMAYTRPESGDDLPPPWKDKSVDPEREAWMIKEMAGYLADTGDSASVSLLAQGISTVNKVYIMRDAAGHPMIDLRLPFERAWASLGRALARGEFRVQDLDRTSGIYYAVYEPGRKKQEPPKAREPGEKGEEPPPEAEVEIEAEAEKGGFMSGMFDWWGDDEDDNPALGRAYRVHMKEAAEGVSIEITRDDGSDFEKGELEFLLGLVKAHLA